MRAICIEDHGGPEVLRSVELAIPEPGIGEVRVKQSVAGINYIDVYVRSGLYPRRMPLVLGREGAGIIDALGPQVADLRIGDRVAYMEPQEPGGYAEYVTVSASEAVPIPSDIDDQIACAAMLQGVTAQYLMRSSYPVTTADTVLVHAAAGGVGRLLTQLCKVAGATVIATAGGPTKVQLVKRAGADDVIDYTATDFAPEVKRFTSGRGVIAAYDSVGQDTFDRSLSVLAPRGYLVLYGASSGPVPAVDPQRLAAAGSVYLARPTLGDFKRTRAELLGRTSELFALIAAGKLDVHVGATYPLAEAAQAHRDLEARKTTGKLLLTL